MTPRFLAVVIGGGQAGLAVGYHLARNGVGFVILESNQRVGDTSTDGRSNNRVANEPGL